MMTKHPKRFFLTSLLLLAGIACAQDKPNIVLLYIDDWAWGGTSVRMNDAMPNSAVESFAMPNIERMAEAGMKFTNAYGSAQCAPARASVQTGQSSARNGFTLVLGKVEGDYYNTKGSRSKMPVIPNISDPSIDPDAVTIPEVLKPLGYVSAHLGKWHLYSDPGAEGYVLHDGETDNKPGNTLGKGNTIDEDFRDPKQMFSITDKAIGFMEQQVRAGNPFYLQISHYAVHNGLEALYSTVKEFEANAAINQYAEKAGKGGDRIRRRAIEYFAMTKDLDTNIGRVLDMIEALGIKDNTYVILVADNGYRRNELMVDPNFTQPLHGHKWWAWEAGIRVPMIVNGPGIAAGSKFTANVVNYDFLPTFVDWAGGDPDALEHIDGVSLAPYMAGERPDASFINRPLYWHVPHYREQIPHSAVIAGDFKVMHFYDSPDTPMLFNLREDPGERSNVATQYPERHGQLFEQMVSYLRSVDARLPKPNPDFDPEVYKAESSYEKFMAWGAFEGQRPLAEDEQ